MIGEERAFTLSSLAGLRRLALILGAIAGSSLVLVSPNREALGVQFQDLFAVEKKASAKAVLARNAVTQAHCQFDEVAEFLQNFNGHMHCQRHGRECPVAPQRQLDLLVAGPPCAPYSLARNQRMQEGSGP